MQVVRRLHPALTHNTPPHPGDPRPPTPSPPHVQNSVGAFGLVVGGNGSSCDVAAAAAASAAAAAAATGQITVEQIVSLVGAMPTESAAAYVKAHVVPRNFPNVTSLAYPPQQASMAAAAAPLPDNLSSSTAAAADNGTIVVVFNSLGQELEVAYDAGG